MSFFFGLPSAKLFSLPSGKTPLPLLPFENETLTKIFQASLKVSTPLLIALVYFSTVHFVNGMVLRRQLRKAGLKELADIDPKQAKRLKPAPYKVATYGLFRLFVLLHNIFLCAYSVWTFFGMLGSFSRTVQKFRLKTFDESSLVNFVYAVCDAEHGVLQQGPAVRSLTLYGWWFYMLKFYEVVDTMIILLKGRPLSLLQSYHHAGAMMCMWSGIRYQLPPIWIFIVFNSFIHLLMYFYFTLCCLKVRVPMIVKRVLTSFQITQFVLGGSLAVFHMFVWYSDLATTTYNSCIATADQMFPIFVNVSYLTPLTLLFAAFYIESYINRKR